MGDTHDDPTDHSRTTQPHAGIAMKDNFFWPGLILLAVATFGLISTAAAAAYRHYEWLSTTVLIAVLGAVAGALWLVMENRRVTRIEAQWDAAHPGSRHAPAHSLITTPSTPSAVTFRDSKPQRPCSRYHFALQHIPHFSLCADNSCRCGVLHCANRFRAPRSSSETLPAGCGRPEMRPRSVSAGLGRAGENEATPLPRREIDCGQLFSASHTGPFVRLSPSRYVLLVGV